MEKGSFVFYYEWLDYLSMLDPAEAMTVLRRVEAWANGEEEGDETLSTAGEMAYKVIQSQVGRDTAKWESTRKKRSEAGLRGARVTNQKKAAKTANAEFAEEDPAKTAVDVDEDVEVDVDVEEEEAVRGRDPSAFDAFWEAYPKKVSKKAARKAFAKVPPEVYPLLVPALEGQKTSRQWTEEGGRFIPNPSTWLTQGRWEDQLDPSGEDPPKPERPTQKLPAHLAEETGGCLC